MLIFLLNQSRHQVTDRVSIETTTTTVEAAFGSSTKLEVIAEPADAMVTWTRDGLTLPESDGGHYDFVSDDTLGNSICHTR